MRSLGRDSRRRTTARAGRRKERQHNPRKTLHSKAKGENGSHRVDRFRRIHTPRLDAANPERVIGEREGDSIASASAPSAGAATTAALSCLVAIPAEHRPIATRFKRYGCWLSAPRADHRRPLCRSRTVSTTGTPLIIFLCHPARLATFWC